MYTHIETDFLVMLVFLVARMCAHRHTHPHAPTHTHKYKCKRSNRFILQSLQALFKISREHPGPCLRAGGLNAVLSNLEFYSTGVQVLKTARLQVT